MKGFELKEASKMLLDSIGNYGDNPFFVEALDEIANKTVLTKLERLAWDTRLQDSMWGEIENHLNHHCHIEDEELFQHAVALLESGWARCG